MLIEEREEINRKEIILTKNLSSPPTSRGKNSLPKGGRDPALLERRQTSKDKTSVSGTSVRTEQGRTADFTRELHETNV